MKLKNLKIFILIIIFLFGTFMCACNDKKVDYVVIETNAEFENSSNADTEVLKSKEEFDQYINTLNLRPYETEQLDSEDIKQFNEEYFKKNNLIILKIISGNTGDKILIKNYSVHEKMLTINLEVESGLGLDKMTYYYYLMKIKKSEMSAVEEIQVKENGKII